MGESDVRSSCYGDHMTVDDVVMTVSDDLDDYDRCVLCNCIIDERADDLVMLMSGDVVHFGCALDAQLRWQE